MAGDRPLGKTQKAILNLLRQRGGVWYPGCGWVWANPSSTAAIMKSLERRGLVTSAPYFHEHRKYTLVTDVPDLLARLQASVDAAIAGRPTK